MNATSPIPQRVTPLSATGRWLILLAGFFGWMFAGVEMSITQLSGQPAAVDLLARAGTVDAEKYQAWQQWYETTKGFAPFPPGFTEADHREWLEARALVGRWFAWYQCAFLFGAATGGFVFGWLGDRVGRSRGVAASILTYSGMAALAYFAQTPWEFLLLWFLACTGVGGMWPNGVALVSEAWPGMSRPLVAGVLGTSANVGLFLMASLAVQVRITPSDWRWTMLVGTAPVCLGVFVLLLVPESPRWLASRNLVTPTSGPSTPGVFRPPLLGVTLVGIVVATVPMMGGWGSANWMIPWAAEAGEASSPPDPFLKAKVGQVRALTGIVGSLLGGWVASLLGRRLSFFGVSLASLLIAQYVFWDHPPTRPGFLFWVGALGFFSGIYFGWLPLCLPELFPTPVRSTGSGVSFNFGRVVTALTVFATGALMHCFGGDYARVGRATSLIFLLGMVIIWFAPDTSQTQLED